MNWVATWMLILCALVGVPFLLYLSWTEFNRKDWSLVGLLLVVFTLLRLENLPYFLPSLVRDPFGVIMESIGGLAGACFQVFVLKRGCGWYRQLRSKDKEVHLIGDSKEDV